MRALSSLLLVGALLLSTGAACAGTLAPAVVRPRVEHHLRHIEEIAGHFESVIAGRCPTFSAAAGWDSYLEAETDRLVLLVAHLEQAWLEAKRTGDDDVRRAAKAPRGHGDQLRQLVEKLRGCAEANGAAFSPETIWRRVERDVPLRQAEIALPR